LHERPRLMTAAPAAPPSAPSALAAVVKLVVPSSIDWGARRRQRMLQELTETAGKQRGVPVDVGQMEAGLRQLEALLPGPPEFCPNLEAMRASDWADVLMDASSVGSRLVFYKVHFPGMNLAKVMALRPQLLLKPIDAIQRDADGVKQLLATAKDVDKLMEAVPTLMNPKLLLSVLVTVNKWYKLKKDPVEVLERDPDLIRRAQECDVPFEPVYENQDGSFQAPQLNYAEKRTEWQAYIDRTFYGQK